jgi:hypothetical protein
MRRIRLDNPLNDLFAELKNKNKAAEAEIFGD